MNTPAPAPTLDDLPLWRLIVALHDAEEVAGPQSESAHALARAVRRKLRAEAPRCTTVVPARLRLHTEEDRVSTDLDQVDL